MNLLLLLSDQQHRSALGCRDPFFHTPHLDAFAREAVCFEQSFCTTPQCSPSRSSIFTGLYPTRTGVLNNMDMLGARDLAQPTWGAELRAAGYQTAYFGKWHLGAEAIARAGWDEATFGGNDAVTVASAIDFLARVDDRERPFALVVSINDPHDIYHFREHQPAIDLTNVPLPPSWEAETFAGKPPIQRQFMTEDQGTAIADGDRGDWQRYRDCYREKTRLLDACAGQVLTALDDRGLRERTAVIVTSDHGDMDAEHRLIFKGPFLYEAMVRVPLMVRLPGALGGCGPAVEAAFPAVNVDLAPTIRELCGLPPQPSDGQSLAPLLTGRGERPQRADVFVQYHGKQQWVNPIRSIRSDRYKLNRHLRWGDELYDLRDDPHELRNLALDPAHRAVLEELGARLERWIRDMDDPFHSLAVTDRAGQPLP